ncbi:zinc finger protein OZF-like [Chrysoperla carnea]|uniref:zinc finger protein OZF-like n=1 Tax=Chrysoperla carnea TaxID=189513 RepID=UPI001D081EA9|nr:zinc finger protein OZF-like [Chrysoperla carnea]
MITNITRDDFDSICRICLRGNYNMLNVNTQNIISMIEACSSLRISMDDELPHQVCSDCLQKLENAYQLRELCEKSDKKLREIIEIKTELENESLVQANNELVSQLYVKREVFIKSEDLSEDDDDTDVYNEHTTGDDSQVSENEKANSDKKKRKKYKVSQYKCDECDQTLDGVWRLGLHMKKKHDSPPIKCDKCDQQFYHRLHLEEHLNNHDESQLHCKECNKKFDSIAKLKKHQVAHRPEQFHCLKCDCSFKGKFMLNKHEQIYHSGSRPRVDCHICGKNVISSNMGAHMKIHQERVPFSCDECPKKFVREITLKEHIMKIHRNQEIPLKQLCTICGRGLRGKSELRRHMRSHTGEKPFPCDMCDKRYRENKALRRHVLSAHMNERPFECTVCSKAFHTKAILQAHMRTHTGERPYSCLVCNKAFGSKSWLKEHIKSHSE